MSNWYTLNQNINNSTKRPIPKGTLCRGISAHSEYTIGGRLITVEILLPYIKLIGSVGDSFLDELSVEEDRLAGLLYE